MIEKLINKISNSLKENTINEIYVIYILTQIRKVLETDKMLEEKYKILKFYCNWALHIKIYDINSIEDVIKNFIEDKDNINSGFLDFNPFGKDFIKFLKEFSIENEIYSTTNSILNFKNVLCNIYVDFPLIIKSLNKKITITDSRLSKNNITLIGYKIEEI